MCRRTLLITVLLPAFAAGVVWQAYQRDMVALTGRIEAAASVEQTSQGLVAYESGGGGVQVLAIHGAGGGHDQGRLLAEVFLPTGYRWIAPSRFGYPGSSLPVLASTAAQADAFVELLDSLRIDKVSVLAMSGGVPPALQFAMRHPDRTKALILLSLAPYAPLTAKEQELPIPLWLYNALFSTDLPLWAMQRLSPRTLAPIFDGRPELIAQMTEEEAAFLDNMITAFLPVTQRRAGLLNEGAAINPAAAIDPAKIAVPTLIVHARDDRITPFSTAAFTAERISGAGFLPLETGGHLLLGHHEEIRQRIAQFLSILTATQ